MIFQKAVSIINSIGNTLAFPLRTKAFILTVLASLSVFYFVLFLLDFRFNNRLRTNSIKIDYPFFHRISKSVHIGDIASSPLLIPKKMNEFRANEWLNHKVARHESDTFIILKSSIQDRSLSGTMRNYSVQQMSRWFEETKDIRAIELLAAAAENKSDECIRDVAIFSLAHLAEECPGDDYIHHTAQQSIDEGLGSSNSVAVRTSSVRSVVLSPSPSEILDVEHLASDSTTPKTIRIAAFDVLGLLHDQNLQIIIANNLNSLSKLSDSDALMIAIRRAQSRNGINLTKE